MKLVSIESESEGQNAKNDKLIKKTHKPKYITKIWHDYFNKKYGMVRYTNTY